MIDLQTVNAASSVGTARTLIGNGFWEAIRGDVGAYRDQCRALLDATDNDCAIPFLFAGAARAALHDGTNWEAMPDGTYRPGPGLLAYLDDLLTHPGAIDCRLNLYVPILRALRHYILDEIAPAWREFALAAQHRDLPALCGTDDFAGAAAFARCLPTPAAARAQRGRHFPRAAQMLRAGTGHPTTVVVCADTTYARAFFPSWSEKAPRLAEIGCGLHLHLSVADADQGVVEALLDRLSDAPGPISLSRDDMSTADRSYFASTRFLFGRWFLEQLGGRIISADADCDLDLDNRYLTAFLAGPCDGRIHGLFNNEYGLGYLPWRRFSASFMAVPGHEGGRSFLGLVGDCVEYFQDSRRDSHWFIDQFALETARRLTPPEQSFAKLNGRVLRGAAQPHDRKRRLLAELPEVRAQLAAGKNLHQALEKRRPGAAVKAG